MLPLPNHSCSPLGKPLPLPHDSNQQVLIIGAGPAGLTAAFELLKHTDLKPIVLESSGRIGGISCTVNHRGNRIDIGGHRFFSKSDRVMQWWLDRMPLEKDAPGKLALKYQGAWREWVVQGDGADPMKEDRVMLMRRRWSRIYHQGKFYAYPLRIDFRTIRNLGPIRLIRMMWSYLMAHLRPRQPERSLADFMINRFGQELYQTFFQSYTEKVWGVTCEQIDASWGHQRIKGLNIRKALLHAWQQRWPWAKLGDDHPETSLIEHFLYPKYGPGQMWETVANEIVELGGEIHLYQHVEELIVKDQVLVSLRTRNRQTGESQYWGGQSVISTMPLSKLVTSLRSTDPVPPDMLRIADGLRYRDFFTVGVLLKSLLIRDEQGQEVPDNWIYIQEPGVKIGRLQLFHNWSPWMTAEAGTYWIGAEYFCNFEQDELGKKTDEELKILCLQELHQLGIIDPTEVLDTVVIRMPRAYPAYVGTYAELPQLTAWLERFPNLFPIGRNGMHRYNNMDHSMLAAMEAVDLIRQGLPTGKHRMWAVNTEKSYHEVQTSSIPPR